MKKFVLILIITLMPLILHSEERKSKSEILQAIKHYQRMMESAQPQPDMKYHKLYEVPSIMAQPSKSAIFKNVNTIDDESAETSRMQNESSIAVNPTNPLNLIASAVDYRAGSSTWVYVSSDGGHTWVNHNLGRPYPGWRSSNDPSVYFSLDGIGYLNYGGFGDIIDSFKVSVGENGVFVAKTIDQGKTWKAHIPVITHRGVQTLDSLFEDKYYVQVDNSPTSPYFKHVYIPWKRVSPRDSATQIVLAKSIDEGETWSVPKPISNRLPGSSEDTTFGQSFPLCATGPNGEVYIVWNHGIEHGIGFAKSLDGGQTFTDPRIIKRYNIFGITRMIAGQGYRHTVKVKVRAEAYPVIQCDITNGPRRGNLYLCWAADNIPNIYFAKSTNQGDTWSDPVIIHSDTTNDQFWPWMSVDPTSGDLAIMYFDSRNDPNNLMVECFVSYSSNGGDTWVDRRAADEQNDLRLNPFLGNAFAGDYSGSAFYNGIVYPTWVDMRNAKLNIYDSDLFTAIINTKAPLPVENLQVKITPEDAEILSLSWENPTERSFGQPLANEDYTIHIKRNGVLNKILPGGTNSLIDAQLEPHKKYTYDVYTVSAGDSSLVRTESSYSGGAKEPGVPLVLKSNGSANFTTTLFVSVPNKRADKTTPLANLQYLALYRDGTFLKNVEVAVSDTGKVIQIIDTPNQEGYYSYSLSAIDAGGNTGEKSINYLAYSGEVRFYSEKLDNFDVAPMAKYFIGGKWQVTNETSVSIPNSLSISPNSKYANEQRDTLMIFPFVTNSQDYYVSFYHAALIATNDYGTAEISTDGGKNWSDQFEGKSAKWKKSDYPAWADANFNELDWKLEELKLPTTADTVYLRWRFSAGPLVNDFGWYVDNIRLSTTSVSVNDNTSFDDVNVYPNPAKEFIKVKLPNSTGIFSYRLVSALGTIAAEGKANPDSFGEFSIKLSNLGAGAYYLYIENETGLVGRESVMVIR